MKTNYRFLSKDSEGNKLIKKDSEGFKKINPPMIKDTKIKHYLPVMNHYRWDVEIKQKGKWIPYYSFYEMNEYLCFKNIIKLNPHEQIRFTRRWGCSYQNKKDGEIYHEDYW